MTVKRRVVITGLGLATPLGLGVDAFWDALIQKRCGLQRIRAFDPAGFPTQIGGEIAPFQLGDFVPKAYRKSAKVMSRDITIAVVSAYHAVTHARLITRCIVDRGESPGPVNVNGARFGANIGAGLVCCDLPELAEAFRTAANPDGSFSLPKWGSEGMNNLTPLWLLKFLPNMLACHVTIVHDAQGPSNTITCAEASSHLAIGEAFRTLARGAADVCICGGAESQTNALAFTRPHLFGRLNADDNDHPERALRPFSANRAGMIVGEGGGLIILESLEHARARGARILAELIGFGAGTSTTHWAKPDPQGKGLSLALRNALRDAQTRPEQIDLVVPFGTGLPAEDAAEISAWNAVFGDHLDKSPALTVRGRATGVTGAGAGAIDVAAAVMAMHHNTVPPSLNTENPDPASRFGFTHKGPRDARITRAISLGYALAGGQAAALVIKRMED